MLFFRLRLYIDTQIVLGYRYAVSFSALQILTELTNKNPNKHQLIDYKTSVKIQIQNTGATSPLLNLPEKDCTFPDKK